MAEALANAKPILLDVPARDKKGKERFLSDCWTIEERVVFRRLLVDFGGGVRQHHHATFYTPNSKLIINTTSKVERTSWHPITWISHVQIIGSGLLDTERGDFPGPLISPPARYKYTHDPRKV